MASIELWSGMHALVAIMSTRLPTVCITLPGCLVADSFGHTTAIRRWPWLITDSPSLSPIGTFTRLASMVQVSATNLFGKKMATKNWRLSREAGQAHWAPDYFKQRHKRAVQAYRRVNLPLIDVSLSRFIMRPSPAVPRPSFSQTASD